MSEIQIACALLAGPSIIVGTIFAIGHVLFGGAQ